MEDKHFETEMNQQMEGFSLQPSVEVWKKVELQIRKEKRRRRFIFWWLPLLLIGTGSAVYFMYPYLQNSNETISVDKRSNDQATVTTEKKQEKDQQPLAKSKPDDIKTNEQPVNKSEMRQQSIPLKVETKANTPEQNLLTKSKTQTNQSVAANINTKQDKPVAAEIKTEIKNEFHAKVELHPVDKKKTDTTENVVTNEQKLETVQPVVTDSAATAPVEPTKTAQKISAVKKQRVEVAIVFRSGITDISQFKTSSVTADMLNATPGTAAPPTAKPSAIKTGVGFSAGVQLKKSISKHSALSTGLAYSFYSTTHQTGRVIYATAQFNNNYLGVSSATRYAISGGNYNYTSKYHFIEIPVMYHLQLNKSAKRPFDINAGIAYNYLVGSNAFYFNQASGNYYYDRQLFNRSQWQLRSGLSVGLIKKLNYPLQAGIQYQYSLSGQWKKSLDLNQHLSFTGVQLLWRLNKK